MTTTGQNRNIYSATIEARPSRFGSKYAAWAARADAWAVAHPIETQTLPYGPRRFVRA